MILKLLIFAISIIQFSVCYVIPNESPMQCAYKNHENFTSYIAVDCQGAVFHPNICDNLKEDVNISSISAVTFWNCEIAEYSDILNRFPNMSKLAFSSNNTLPSADFSNFEHLTLFKNLFTKFKTTPASLTINAADLESFSFAYEESVTSLSMGNATKLEAFLLRNTAMPSLPVDLFDNSTNLKMLMANMNNIESIDTMHWPQSLRWMDLSKNKIAQLTKNSLKNLTNLQILDLSYNEINQIEAETFSQLNNLVWLALSNNHMKVISKNMLNGAQNLLAAKFEENEIESIEDGAFESMSKLWGLELAHNNISILNQRMLAGLNRLTVLNLEANSIRELTAESFGNLTDLRILEMEYGMLETVDFNAFAKLPKLGYVKMANNKISRLVKMAPTTWNGSESTNSTFTKEMFEALEKVDLKWMMPMYVKTELFENWGYQQSLLEIDETVLKKMVAERYMNSYPELVNGSNYGLKLLDLSGNLLTEIEKNIFAEFKSLKELILSRNPITTLHPESFAGLNKLVIINLVSCKLASVDFSMFTTLTKLQTLELSNNQLTTITAASLPSIKIIRLNDNQLTAFTMKKSDFPNLNAFNIRNNPLNCTNMDPSFVHIQFDCNSQKNNMNLTPIHLSD